jgi:FkbM family methyltransferase
MYETDRGAFRTPRGVMVTLIYRRDSSDWNTLWSCLNEDEYRLKGLRLEGTALDIGAHIGGATVALAVDNPELHIIAVEAVPPNVELLRQNVELNGLTERVSVVAAAAGKGGRTTIRWGFEGNESADHHAFIGNSLLPGKTKHRTLKVDSLSLGQIINSRQISFAKVDCEGCEYEVLRGPALAQIALIRGELHGITNHDPAEVATALLDTHHVTTTEPLPAPFEAVLR